MTLDKNEQPDALAELERELDGGGTTVHIFRFQDFWRLAFEYHGVKSELENQCFDGNTLRAAILAALGKAGAR